MSARKKKGRKSKKTKKKLFPFKISELIDPLYIKLLIGIVVLMSLISGSLIVVGQLKERRAIDEEQREIQAFQEGLNRAFSLLTLSDFMLPEQFGKPGNHIYLQRERHSIWTQEEVDRMWIPIDETGLENLTEENHLLIDKLLGESR